MADGYQIRAARAADVASLGAIEARAGALFDGLVPDDAAADNVPVRVLADAAAEDRLFVAENSAGDLVGFAVVILLEDGSAHLEELDVVPEHGRRGLGSALVDAACRWTKASGRTTLSLTTYRDVPFNAPYYVKLGFEKLSGEAITPALARVIEHERAKGLDVIARVAMRRNL